jgi:hypothetical protein
LLGEEKKAERRQRPSAAGIYLVETHRSSTPIICKGTANDAAARLRRSHEPPTSAWRLQGRR